MQQISLNVTTDYKYYILFCGLFNKNRNVVKYWPEYEKAFLELVKQDGSLGIKRLFQVIVLYFVRRDESQQKYVETFLKKLYD